MHDVVPTCVRGCLLLAMWQRRLVIRQLLEAVPVFRNQMPRYEVLSPEQLEQIERGWQRLVSEVGVQFDHPRALEVR